MSYNAVTQELIYDFTYVIDHLFHQPRHWRFNLLMPRNVTAAELHFAVSERFTLNASLYFATGTWYGRVNANNLRRAINKEVDIFYDNASV